MPAACSVGEPGVKGFAVPVAQHVGDDNIINGEGPTG
jgi:hypothetical protein